MNITNPIQTHRQWSPYVIFITSLLLTCICTLYVAYRAESEDRFRFDNEVNITTSTIESQFNTYITALLGGRGLFDASDDVTRDEFRAYALGLELHKKYPGVAGFGFIKKVEPYEIPGLTDEMVAEGYNSFRIYPQGDRPSYFIIRYIEPADKKNITSIGYDMYSEAIRKKAMDLAIQTGNPTMSGKITLIQDSAGKSQPGFLMFVPVYKTKNIPTTDKENQIYGFIYSSFRINDLLNSMFHNKNLQVAFHIYDNSISNKNLMYSSSETSNYTPLFTTSTTLSIANKKWIMTFESLPPLEHASERKLLSTILIGGVTISLLLFLLSLIQLRARESAERSALVILNSEQALQESNHRISNILNSITDGFIALDRHWRFTYINKAAARTMRRLPEQVLGRTIWDVLPDLEQNRFGRLYKRSMAENVPLELEHYYEPFKAWLSVRVYPSQSGLSIYFADMTERHRLEKQKDDFLGVASHELKTPVTSIKAYIQVLQNRFQKASDLKSYSLLTKVDSQINKLTGLIHDLLDVTKIEAGKLTLQYQSVDLNSLVKQTVEEIQITTDRHIIKIEGEINNQVTTDPERVAQVLTNLLSNAVKYSPRSNKIIVRISKEDSNCMICVQDFGVGIAKEMQNKVFDRFFRVSDPNRITYPGLGLGLYISSEIVKRLKGKMWLTSRDGEGSAFFFSIPSHS